MESDIVETEVILKESDETVTSIIESDVMIEVPVASSSGDSPQEPPAAITTAITTIISHFVCHIYDFT